MTSAVRTNEARGVARTAHSGSKGLRTAPMPAARAARSRGRNTFGNIWVCLWVSMCVKRMPRFLRKAIWAEASASISALRIRPEKSRIRNVPSLGGKQPVSRSTSVGIWRGESTGSPSTRTMWHPVPSDGFARDKSMASSVAAAFAIRVVLVSTPDWCSSTIARFTPDVRPKSSAFTIKRLTGQVYQSGATAPGSMPRPQQTR